MKPAGIKKATSKKKLRPDIRSSSHASSRKSHLIPFPIHVPSSLHAALEREAVDEGVSLNQLVVAKLAVQLKTASARKRLSGRWKSS